MVAILEKFIFQDQPETICLDESQLENLKLFEQQFKNWGFLFKIN